MKRMILSVFFITAAASAQASIDTLHIRQKNSDTAKSYTVVKADGYSGPLSQHPCIIAHPELFEVVDADIPSDAQYLIYKPENE